MLSRWLDVVRLRIRSLVSRDRVESELDRELALHLEYQVAEHVADGMSPDDARRAALRSFGGVTWVKEEVRDVRGTAIVENLARDFRYTLRGLRHDPMLLLAAATSIALGVGGNLAVHGLAREFLFARPDVREPSTLVRMQVSHGSHASYVRWRDLHASGALAAVAGFSVEDHVNWFDGEQARSLVPMLVTANFFDVVAPPMALGRGFRAVEAEAERDPRVVVVSHRFWQGRLGGDSAVIGRSILVDGESYSIAGVLAPRLRTVVGFGIAPELVLPLNRALVPELRAPSASIVSLVGRLKPGQTLAQGRAAVDAADRRLGRLAGDTVYAGVQEFAIAGEPTGRLGRTAATFFALLGLVSIMVLLIASANVAGLLVARGTARRREIAIRLALGGSRARLMQQFLVEGFWLALLGTVFGAGLAALFMQAVNGVALPLPFPIELHLAPDVSTLAAALGLVLVCMLLCALLPALTSTRDGLTPALKREEPRVAGSRLRLRGALLVGQVTVSTVLLVTSFLFVRNLARSQTTDPGFDVQRGIVAQLGLDESRPIDEQVALLERAVERARALPGVEDAAYSRILPLTANGGASSGGRVRFDGRPRPQHVQFARGEVGPGYFGVMGIRLRQGRDFADADATGSPRVVIVNDEFVRQYLPGEQVIGRQLRFEDHPDVGSVTIVGVVANSRHHSIGEEQRAAVYKPVRQLDSGLGVAFVIARAHGEPMAIAPAMRDALGALDRGVSVEVLPLTSALVFALMPSRIGAVVVGSLGMLGLVLAMFGLYAIIAYTVTRRTGEIAIRTALGATRRQVVRLVVRDASVLVGAGVALGLAIAAFVTRPLATFLVAGLGTTDPLSFAATAAAFALVAALAAWVPARRATRVSPALAMRLE